jgi:phosphomannomutase
LRRKLIAFDLDGTLAETKSPISSTMAEMLRDLLSLYEVCVISGGDCEQFALQLIAPLDGIPEELTRLHLMPTSGTKYLRFDDETHLWVTQYSEDLSPETRTRTIEVLMTSAKTLGYWEPEPWGPIIEDRGTQITFSALGQQAPAAKKYAWDPDGAKKRALRDLVAKQLPDLEVHLGGTTSVDVTNAGIDKAYGMQKLMVAEVFRHFVLWRSAQRRWKRLSRKSRRDRIDIGAQLGRYRTGHSVHHRSLLTRTSVVTYP